MTDTLDQGAEAAGTDIAIVGMSGRFPGSDSASLLMKNVDAARSIRQLWIDDNRRIDGNDTPLKKGY